MTLSTTVSGLHVSPITMKWTNYRNGTHCTKRVASCKILPENGTFFALIISGNIHIPQNKF